LVAVFAGPNIQFFEFIKIVVNCPFIFNLNQNRYLMKKLLFIGLTFLVCCGLANAQETPFVDGELLVELEVGYKSSDILSQVVQIDNKFTGMTEVACLSKIGRIYHFRYNHQEHDQYRVLDQVKRITGVSDAQFNHLVEDRAVPTDPQFGSQWHHVDASDNDIDSDLAWNTTTGGSTTNGFSIVACVVEPGGMTWGHPDLVGNHWTNPGEIANNGIDDDGNGRVDDFDGWNTPANNDNISNAAHGAGVMGMIGAVANNGNGGAGVNWNIDLMPVVVGGLSEANVIAAYDYALDMRTAFNASGGANGAFVVVINSSWGIDNANAASFPLWCNFYNTMGVAGILNCAATANNNVNIDVVGDMPTTCTSPYLISVTATNSSDVRTFSAFGATHVDLGAPGEAVWLPNSSTYQSWSGTSFASPCVAGAVGLLYSAPCANLGANAISSPWATALLVRDAIFDSVDPTVQLSTECTTGGRLNVNSALNLLIASCGPPPGCVELVMTDVFGDGWNGAVYNVYNSVGTLVATGTMVGSTQTVNICLGDGCFSLEVTAGSFPSEIGWTLNGSNGGSLSGGANAFVGFNIGAVVNGCTNAAACNYSPSANCDNGTCCYANCATINMTDSFGDGWNGATYTVTDTFGFTVSTGTLAGGSSGSNLLCLADGCYNISVSSGIFPSEIGWSLSGANGIVSGGAPANVNFTVGNVIEGCTDWLACNYNPLANCSDGACVYCQTSCVTFTMTDSFGDSWNGATYTVTDFFGSTVASGTLNTFYDDIQVDALCLTGGCYTLTVTAGSFPSEIGWTLGGNIVGGPISGGASTSISFTVGGAIYGCTDWFACNYNPAATCDEGCVFCPNPCVNISMTDSFGDGWNGAVYNVYDQFGNIIVSGTMDGGNFDSDINALCIPGGCYTLEVTSGGFPSEISWTLGGEIIGGPISGGAPANISFAVSGAIFGCTDWLACNYNPAATCDDACEYCPDPCVNITLNDSYGDGWNGAVYNIYDNFGGLVLTGTMDGGNFLSDVNSLCLLPGCYSIQVTSGSWPSEISWSIGGNILEGTVSGGAPANATFTIYGYIEGCTDPSACNYNAFANCNGTCDYCLANCVSLTMTDSYPDGWNGASYSVFDSVGNLVQTGNMGTNSSLAVDAICLPNGCYTMTVTGGSFPSEIGWTLNGANGGAISGGAQTTISFTVGTAILGCTNCEAFNYNPSATCDNGSCIVTCPGDFSGDGIIGATDLLVFLGSFGSVVGPCSLPDLNNDAVVGLADLLIFLGVYGTNCP